MQIKSFGSGSYGNCFWISDVKTELLLEAGINIKTVQNQLNFKLSNISGCLVTHFHGDHSKYIQQFIKKGINIYSASETFEELQINSPFAKIIEPYQSYEIGTFKIIPFKTVHDCDGALGFVIYSKLTGEQLLFATDTAEIKHTFKNLDYIMIECNWSEQTLDPECPYYDRLRYSHLSLEKVLEFLSVIDLSKVKEIWLLHLSSSNSDAEFFKKEVQKLTGKIIKIA